MIGVIIFLLGLALGSFFNVCIYRIPIDKSIVFPPSHCTSCNNRLKAKDLVPVFSYIFLKGKCRYCKSKVSIRYPFVELLTGLMYFISYLVFGLSWSLLISLVFVSLLLIITFTDLDHMIIPDEIILVGLIAALVYQLVRITPVDYFDAIIGLLVGGGSFLLIALLSKLILKKEGMGGGDIKLMAMIGATIGWKLTVLTIFLSAYIAAILGGGMILLKIKKKGQYLPYGPFIAIAAIVALYWGNDIINWWLGM